MSIVPHCLKICARVCFGASLLSAYLMPSSVVAQSYALVDLSAAIGESPGAANGINNLGVVVGVESPGWAVRWQRIASQWNREILPSKLPPVMVANAVSDCGIVVGWAWQLNSSQYPMIWIDGNYEVLPLVNAEATDVNDSGQVVGSKHFLGPLLGFVWEDGELSFLGDIAQAFGINAHGQVVGGVGVPPDGYEAALWENNQGEWELTAVFGTLGGSSSEALEISEKKQIVGWAHIPGDCEHAFLWEDGVMIDLGTLGGNESVANDVNNIGQVVGWAEIAEEEDRAFLWQDGVMTDLNDLVVSETDLVLTKANAINDLGTIVGRGRTSEGVSHAFLARPLRAGDLNLDAFVDAFDLAFLLGSWGPCADCDACPAELDNDCTVGPFDLAILLANWG